jgi:ADP-ribosylglycohydrolase
MMKNPNPNMLLFCAMADAYATAVKYNPSRVLETLKMDKYYAHPDNANHRPGEYTGDTEMSIANANLLVATKDPSSLTGAHFTQSYYRQYLAGKKRKVYPRRLQDALVAAKSEHELWHYIKPLSPGNESTARSVPIGILPSIDEVIRLATIQAGTTNNTPDGRTSAVAVALLCHFTLYSNEPFDKVCEFTMRAMQYSGVSFLDTSFLLEPWDESEMVICQWTKPISIVTVQAVAHFLRTETGLMDTLMRVIRTGGDTNSVAAILWSILSTRTSEKDRLSIPAFMRRDLEPSSNTKSVQYLELIGHMLMYRFKN